MATDFPVCGRALSILGDLQGHQEQVPRPAALAWERAAFTAIFDDPEPGQRIRRFLEKA